MRSGAWWGLVAFVAVVGCGVLPSGDVNDGEACKTDGDCDSGRCTSGICTRDCKEDRGSCQSGWICQEFERDNIIFSGTSTSYECVATCAACPSTMYCPPGDQTTDDKCQRKPWGPDVRFVDPGELPLGEPVVLKATLLASRSPVKAYRWSFNDGTDPIETPVPEVTHTFLRRTSGSSTVTATDANGASNTTPFQLQFRCGEEGAQCAVEGGCCVTDTYCLPPDGGGFTVCRRVAPLTAKIEGPALVPEGPATFDVIASPSPTAVTWSLEGDFGSSESGTTTHTFELSARKARHVVIARVTDALERSVEAKHEVAVCAREKQHCNGRFGYVAPCCEGLTCSPGPFSECVTP
ncbi:MAG: PKD domain-containing protein [Labilithrix sp.]|nr:PKD domain-containing protein [Labilithrix sp.]MCW5818015.1 PKD domain-containing protein [Labilithrix sp.]